MQAMSAENSWVAVKFLWPEPAPRGKRNATTGLVSFHPSTNHPLDTGSVCEKPLHRSWALGMLLGGWVLLCYGRSWLVEVNGNSLPVIPSDSPGPHRLVAAPVPFCGRSWGCFRLHLRGLLNFLSMLALELKALSAGSSELAYCMEKSSAGYC